MSNSVIKVWNSLPEEEVDADALIGFKGIKDHVRIHKPQSYGPKTRRIKTRSTLPTVYLQDWINFSWSKFLS